jgi:hypothetical protein
MAADDVYRKTEKGRTEIATRVNKLGMRERTLLIMVDDKTSRSGLLARGAHPSSGEILDALVAQGFIEIASAGSSVSEPAASGGASVAAAAPVEVSLTSASRHACRALVSYLGPAADDLTALIEKSKGAAELGTTLEKCRQIIQSLAGKQKADEFWAGVSARLPEA